MKTTNNTKAIANKMYSFNSRFDSKEDARERVLTLNNEKHAYYTAITSKGAKYFDVRTEN